MSDERMMRGEQVAALLEVSERRVRQIPASELPYLQLTPKGIRKYHPFDVAEYRKRKTVRA